MSDALLKVLPMDGPGLTWPAIVDAVASQVSEDLFPQLKTVRWYSICVRLDLEAKGLVERLQHKKSLHFKRVETSIS